MPSSFQGFQAYISVLTRVADLLCILGAGWLAYWARFDSFWIRSENYLNALIVGSLLVLIDDMAHDVPEVHWERIIEAIVTNIGRAA